MGGKLIKTDPQLFKAIDKILEKSWCGYVGCLAQRCTLIDPHLKRLNSNYILEQTNITILRKHVMYNGKRLYIYDIYSKRLIINKLWLYLNYRALDSQELIDDYLKEFNASHKRKMKIK